MGVPKGSPKHGGRQKGSLNKRTVELQQAIASRLRRPRVNSLEKMRQLAGIIEGLASGWLKGNTVDEQLPDGTKQQVLKPGVDIREGVHLVDAAQRAWNRVSEYEHPKLQSVHLTQQPLDLSKLSDGQLADLERLVAVATLDRADQGGATPTTH